MTALPVEIDENVLYRTQAHRPWQDKYTTNNDYASWFAWMQIAGGYSDFQRTIFDMKAGDAMRLYEIMNSLVWECHNNHVMIKRVKTPEKVEG